MVLREGAGSLRTDLPWDGGGKGGGVFPGWSQIGMQAQSAIRAEKSTVVALHLRRKRRERKMREEKEENENDEEDQEEEDSIATTHSCWLPGWRHLLGSPPTPSRTSGLGTCLDQCTCVCNTGLPQSR